MRDLTESQNENFFPSGISEMNACPQKKFFANYFIPVTEREDIHWNFKGFLGFNFGGEIKYYGFLVNSPQQIENLTLSSSLGVKNIFRPEKGIFLFDMNVSSSVPETDSRLESLEKYVLGLKETLNTKMYRRVSEGERVISRYHPKNQQLEFVNFLEHLSVASAEKTLDAYGGDFFNAYVRSAH